MGEQPLRSGTRPNARTNTARPYADIPRPITEADAHAEPPAERLMREPSVITLTTAFEHRGYHLTVSMRGMALDAFCDALDTDSSCLFTVSTGAHYREQFIVIEMTNTTLDRFCDMLDKRLGVPS